MDGVAVIGASDGDVVLTGDSVGETVGDPMGLIVGAIESFVGFLDGD